MAKKSKKAEPVLDRITCWLFTPVDIASMAFFRVAFGLVVVGLVLKLWKNGFIEAHYIEPQFRFKYPFFGWVSPLPDVAMYVVFIAMAIAGAFITVGFMYRASAITFGILWTYTFLLCQSVYQNHFYLLCLMGLLAAAIPMHRQYSVDAWLRPTIRSETIPAWCLYFVRFQIGCVYFFGGVHKLNPDWLHGEPMRAMIWGRALWFPEVGSIFYYEPVVYFFTMGGLILDLFVVPALLWRRTRMIAFAITLFFHLSNWGLWYIGIFPPFMIAATALYFRPDWPRLLVRRLRGNAAVVKKPEVERSAQPIISNQRRFATVLLVTYAVVQFAIPWRPYLLNPGHLLEQEDLMWFSWNMMLCHRTGTLHYVVTDLDTGEEWKEESGDYLLRKQWGAAIGKPDMAHQLALHIAEQSRTNGHQRVSVRAINELSLNYRYSQLHLDPTVDLASTPRSLGVKSWVMPLQERHAVFRPERRDFNLARWQFLHDEGYLPYAVETASEEEAAALAEWERQYWEDHASAGNEP